MEIFNILNPPKFFFLSNIFCASLSSKQNGRKTKANLKY